MSSPFLFCVESKSLYNFSIPLLFLLTNSHKQKLKMVSNPEQELCPLGIKLSNPKILVSRFFCTSFSCLPSLSSSLLFPFQPFPPFSCLLFQYLLVAAEPYETIAFKIPNSKLEGGAIPSWDRETLVFKIELHYEPGDLSTPNSVAPSPAPPPPPATPSIFAPPPGPPPGPQMGPGMGMASNPMPPPGF